MFIAFLSNYLYGVISFGWPIFKYISVALACLLICALHTPMTVFIIILIILLSAYLLYSLYKILLVIFSFIAVLNQADDFFKKSFTILSGLTALAINFCIVYFPVRWIVNG